MRKNLSIILTVVFMTATIISRGAIPLTFTSNDAASIGIYIEDLRTGEMTDSHNAGLALTPASILKTVTAASSLLSLGKDYRYTTDFLIAGSSPQTGEGRMIIKASGDPSMGGRKFEESASLPTIVANRLNDLGIERLSGDITIDDSVLPEGGGVIPGWEVEDITESYGAGLFAINWMDNYFESDYVIDNPVDFFREELIGAITRNGIVTGEAPIEIIEPEYMEEDSIAITQTEDTLLIYSHKSEPLAQIMRVMMEKSVNLLAEGNLRAIAPYQPVDSAIAIEKALWKSNGIDLTRSRILDGSGLARGNAISPRQIGRILTYMAKSEECDTYVGLFPKAGKEGTVKTLLAGSRLAGHLALKSGSMGGVHCYAGYKLDSNGKPTHTIVIMVNNFFCPRTQLRKSIERYLLKTFPQ